MSTHRASAALPTAGGQEISGLGALPGIGLEEITERAGLMTRVDRKYVLPREEVGTLLAAAGGDLRVLEIDGRRRFSYRSLYYDTPDLTAYRAAATGRRRRWKVRRRDYLDTGTSFLEVKTRTGRGESAKLRLPLPADGSGAGPAAGRPLSGAGLEHVRTTLLDAGCAVPAQPLVPVLATTYARTTVLIADEDARLTLDDSLSWIAADGQMLHLDGEVVVETKAGTRPGRVDRALWRAGHRPQRLSKYATGLALLDDSRSANRWHRTLRDLPVA